MTKNLSTEKNIVHNTSPLFVNHAKSVSISGEDLNLWGSGFKKSLQKHPKEKLHRSDMLLKTQFDVVKEITAMFKTLVDSLQNNENLTTLKLQNLINVHQKIQYLKLVLEVLQKIKLELDYLRSKFYDHMKKQSKEAELIRQRIVWLEHRLEKIVTENTAEKLTAKFQTPLLTQHIKRESGSFFSKHRSFSPPQKNFSFKKSSLLKKTDEDQTESFELDEGGKYWLSDHHRFIYTPDIRHLLKENPLSYHSVGLAVPASYVDENVFSAEKQVELPWMSEQDPAKGNFDIMREDLEMLRTRIFQIHEKIGNAAKRSINLKQPFSPPLLQITGVDSHETFVRPTTNEEFQRNKSVLSSFSPSPKMSSAFHKPRKPLHYVDTENILPTTRTNFSKKYPHECDHWSSARPDGVDQQPIIVNQRDLKNKTKLRLFISKRLKKRKEHERDLITPSSVSSNRSYRKGAPTVRFIENLKSSDGSILSDLQRNRLDELMDTLLTSPRRDDRVYAARSLSTLGVTALENVIPALVDALADTDDLVRYGAAKALIILGEWHEAAIKELIAQLKLKNQEVSVEIMNVLTCSDAARTALINSDDNPELAVLIKILSDFVSKDDDELSFYAAACLGEIVGNSDEFLVKNVKNKLLKTIKTTTKWDWHSQALEVLVRRLHYFDEVVFKAAVTQLKHAVKWKDRLAAALLVAYAGPTKVFQIMEEKDAFELFYPNLWDDPKREVRVGVSQAFTALGLRNRLLEKLDEQITNPNPETRAHAVMSMSAVGIRSDKTLRSLIEMLGLDSSDYVRLQIMRVFHALTITDIRAVRALRDREKGGGVLGKEASKILASLDVRLTTGFSSIGNSRQSARSGNQANFLTRGETDFSWFQSPSRSRSINVTTKQSKRHSRHGYTPSSYRSSTGFASSPMYEIISTTGRRNRHSDAFLNRAPTANTHVSSVSSFF